MTIYPIYILTIEDDSDRALMMRIYDELKKLIYARVIAVVEKEEDQEDVYQNVLMNLIDRIASLREKEWPVVISYVDTTARNTALNFIRKNSKYNGASFEEAWGCPDPAEGVEDYLIRVERLDQLKNVWSGLDERTKALLRLKHGLRKSSSEMAEEMNTTPENARMGVTRAHRRAAKAMKKD